MYKYTTSTRDPDGNKVRYTFDWGDGKTSVTSLVNSGTSASYSHSWSAAGTYEVKAKAMDSKGASSGYSSSLSVIIAKNNPPNTPTSISGPSSGKIRTSYKYTTSATDPDNDKVKYTFDWGDGKTSVTSLVNSGTSASSYHSWSKTGTFYIKVMATDSKGATSEWSNQLAVTINMPPNKPSTPSGAKSGYAWVSYGYSTSATDPDKDQVKYTFDWGDGTTSTTDLVDSGTSTSSSHSWGKAGTFYIKTKATDSKGAVSGWSSVLAV